MTIAPSIAGVDPEHRMGVSASTSVTITIVLGVASHSAALTVLPASVRALSFDPPTVAGGSSALGIPALDGAAPTSGVTVALSSGDPAAASVPTSVALAAALRMLRSR